MNNENRYTGKDLLSMGCQSGPVVGKLLEIVNATPHTNAEVEALIQAHAPPTGMVPLGPAGQASGMTAPSTTQGVRKTTSMVAFTAATWQGVTLASIFLRIRQS